MEQQDVIVGGQRLSPCDVAALQKCLKEHKGDRRKCEKEVLAFQQACAGAPNTRSPSAAAAAAAVAPSPSSSSSSSAAAAAAATTAES